MIVIWKLEPDMETLVEDEISTGIMCAGSLALTVAGLSLLRFGFCA